MPRSDEQIVADANALAREFYLMLGYQVKEGFKFNISCHPQEQACWAMAVRAYEKIQCTDVEDALANIED